MSNKRDVSGQAQVSNNHNLSDRHQDLVWLPVNVSDYILNQPCKFLYIYEAHSSGRVGSTGLRAAPPQYVREIVEGRISDTEPKNVRGVLVLKGNKDGGRNHRTDRCQRA